MELRFREPVDRPDDYPFYMCVRRITLDDILVRRMKETPNVNFVEGKGVTALLRNNGRITGVRWGKSGHEEEAEAEVVVGADGVNSFVAKEVGPQTKHLEPVNRAMYYAYYRGVKAKEGPAAEFHYRGNTLVYCFPCDNDLTLIAVSVPISQFEQFKRNTQAEFQNELATVGLGPRLTSAEREGPLRGTGSIPGYLRIPYGNGWALVGDAGMVMDPWSGQGMDQAATHAVLLAKSLHGYLSGTQNWEPVMQAYHRERKEFSLKTYRRTCRFSVDLRPMTREALDRRGLL